jgi:2-polyprenyl-3-methyl-5-hydroxy-6-metoxy-1,4-benzoquinol methylase
VLGARHKANFEKSNVMRRNRFIPKPMLVDKESMILRLAQGKSCLHVGMGGFVDDQAASDREFATGAFQSLHGGLARVTNGLVGIDINRYALDNMAVTVPGEYILCDVTSEQDVSKLAGRQFEIIIFGDVIEHLDNPGIALCNLRRLLAENGHILITTVNAYCLDAILKLLMHYESVHEEHTAYYSYSTLKRLLSMNGMEVLEFMYYTNKRIFSFGSVMHRIAWYFEKPLIRVLPQYAMGIVAVAGASPIHNKTALEPATHARPLTV